MNCNILVCGSFLLPILYFWSLLKNLKMEKPPYRSLWLCCLLMAQTYTAIKLVEALVFLQIIFSKQYNKPKSGSIA